MEGISALNLSSKARILGCYAMIDSLWQIWLEIYIFKISFLILILFVFFTVLDGPLYIQSSFISYWKPLVK